MSKSSDIRVTGASVWLLPVRTRVPLKFGTEILDRVTCARVAVRVQDRRGRTFVGWGETPLSVQWGWPSAISYEARLETMTGFLDAIARSWVEFAAEGHPLEIGWDFVEERLPQLLREANGASQIEPMPWLAALISASAFDLAIHDAFGHATGRDIYTTYTPEFMNRDLAAFLKPAAGTSIDFRGQYPAEFLKPRQNRLMAWHLVGGVDPIDREELRGEEPADGHPVLLADWIRRDGLKCLKVKLRGNDQPWDYARLVRVGTVAMAHDVLWLTADFNCTVRDPEYVTDILDRLRDEHPRIYGMLLYVEQPFPYDLDRHRIDAHALSARKPLFLDESAHAWREIQLGRSLGWTGVALKTCKTQSGAILSLCWARAHGMTLMVQDLTNPMLAQIPHLLLAAHSGTIMGVETNGMQFYPAASAPEAEVHPGCYTRREGMVTVETVTGPGFGYGLDRMRRELPAPHFQRGEPILVEGFTRPS
jgi:L-alanine-DL-glutamate epimerase-like enolase superfamily enzyme